MLTIIEHNFKRKNNYLFSEPRQHCVKFKMNLINLDRCKGFQKKSYPQFQGEYTKKIMMFSFPMCYLKNYKSLINRYTIRLIFYFLEDLAK